MKVEQSTMTFIEGFEGRRYKAYQDGADKSTIGVGHLIKPDEKHLLTAILTDDQVNDLFYIDLKSFADSINRQLKKPVTQNQFDALCSFAFNLGMGSLLGSTLWKNFSKGTPVVEGNFTAWSKIRVNGELVESKGLLNRRKKEYLLFTTK